MNCQHNTQKRIGVLDAFWCCYCGAIKLGNGDWQLPAVLVKTQPAVTEEDKDTPQ